MQFAGTRTYPQYEYNISQREALSTNPRLEPISTNASVQDDDSLSADKIQSHQPVDPPFYLANSGYSPSNGNEDQVITQSPNDSSDSLSSENENADKQNGVQYSQPGYQSTPTVPSIGHENFVSQIPPQNDNAQINGFEFNSPQVDEQDFQTTQVENHQVLVQDDSSSFCPQLSVPQVSLEPTSSPYTATVYADDSQFAASQINTPPVEVPNLNENFVERRPSGNRTDQAAYNQGLSLAPLPQLASVCSSISRTTVGQETATMVSNLPVSITQPNGYMNEPRHIAPQMATQQANQFVPQPFQINMAYQNGYPVNMSYPNIPLQQAHQYTYQPTQPIIHDLSRHAQQPVQNDGYYPAPPTLFNNFVDNTDKRRRQILAPKQRLASRRHLQSPLPYLQDHQSVSSPDDCTRADLNIIGDLEDAIHNWTPEEVKSHRRLVEFTRVWSGSIINCTFSFIPAHEYESKTISDNQIVISCIRWPGTQDHYITSVDCINLLQKIMGINFKVEEKNRVRRNLEGCKPTTVGKCHPETAGFFKVIMGYQSPKPRNIEKDIKVFPWESLGEALKKIVAKYTASKYYFQPQDQQIPAIAQTNPV